MYTHLMWVTFYSVGEEDYNKISPNYPVRQAGAQCAINGRHAKASKI